MSKENFKVSKQTGSSTLFAMTGQTAIYQRETVTEREYRGEDDDTTVVDVIFSNNYAETTWYKAINGEVHSFTAVTGTKTEWSGRRYNEAGFWRATKTDTVYAVSPNPANNGWTTTKIDKDGNAMTASASGAVVETFRDNQINYVFTFKGKTLLSTTESVVEEHRYLTQQAAQSLVSSFPNGSNMTYKAITCTSGVSTSSRELPIGTVKTASMSAGENNTWTVTKTTVTHGYVTGKGWTAAS